ncbi:MAG: tRNA 2-thiouridine(34) synthase MnmA [Bulleidia sp.]|nr:tRNA 2-thiouridine(34) synthase MnmA [Bulleidia sp.]
MTKIMVGLSGGVDSAVAAYLLKQLGYDVTCAFMRNWDSLINDDISGNPDLSNPVCTQEQDYNDAASVARALDLPLLRVDFIEEYWNDVFARFLEEYRKGRTPNPDILCNRYIKFDSFMKFGKEHGFDTVATGHYAKLGERNGKHVLMKADDRNKDQSYFLCEIHRDTLDHVLFPLGSIDKPEVRRIAEELHLSIAKKKDSTGICFIGERKFREFLSNYLPMKPGKIIDIAAHEVVGEHKGVLYYTVGQRKGLDIGGTGPYYCAGKDIYANELYVTDQAHQEWLVSDSCLVSGFNTLADFDTPLHCMAKFRYRQPDQDVIIERLDDHQIKVAYPQGIRSVTPGQEAVFYKDDAVLGGGEIEQVFVHEEDLMQKISAEGKKHD